MSDAIARELALEACQAAPMGARMVEVPVSYWNYGSLDYTVMSGNARAAVSFYGRDDDDTDLYLYTFAVLDVDGLYGEEEWGVVAEGAGDAEHVREALLKWAEDLTR